MRNGLLLILLTFLIIVSSAYALNENTVSYYRSDINGNFLDSVGTTTPAIQGATFSTIGIVNGSYIYDGSNDYIDTNTDNFSDTIVSKNDFSVDFWVNLTSITDLDAFISNLGMSNLGFVMYLNSAGNIVTRLYDGSSHTMTSNSSLSTGEWYYITYTRDDIYSRIYINGALDNTEILDINISGSVDDFLLGAWFNNGRNLDGKLDEIGIYNKTMSISDISFRYNGGSPGVSQQYPFSVDSNFTITTLDTFSNPVNNASINITYQNGTIETYNNESGNIVITSIPPDSTDVVNISASADGFLTYENTNFNLSAGLLTIEFANSTNRITFTDNNSNPIVGAEVTITYPNGNSISTISDENGRAYWSTFYVGNPLFGIYNITLEATDGYLTPYLVQGNLTPSTAPLYLNQSIELAAINITIKDAAFGNIITNPLEITLINIGIFNITNGNLYIQNASVGSGNYTGYIFSTEYETAQQTFSYNGHEVKNVTFYLVNASAPDTGSITVNVFDEGFNLQLNADTRLLQYFSDVDSFIEVDQCYTNSNGQCFFPVELNNKLYKIIASRTDGNIVLSGQSSDNGEIFATNGYEVDIHMYGDISYEVPLLYGFSLTATNTTLLNNISYLTGNWIDTQGTSRQVCVRYSLLNYTIKTQLSGGLNCASGSSGSINVFGGYNLSNMLVNNNVYVELFVNNSGNEIVYFEDIYLSQKSLEKEVGPLAPYLMLIGWVGLLALTLYLKKIYIFGIGNIILSLLAVRLLPTYTGWQFVVTMILLSGLLFYIGRKEEGNIAT